jgi:hypothetical protein
MELVIVPVKRPLAPSAFVAKAAMTTEAPPPCSRVVKPLGYAILVRRLAMIGSRRLA